MSLCTTKHPWREPQKNSPICWKHFCCDLKGWPRGEKLLFNTQGTRHSGAPEAAVPAGVLAQVLLVVIFRIVKGLSLPDVRGDQAETMLRQNLLVVLLGPQGCPHVLSRGRVDGGAVLRAVVVALAHALGRVMILPEDLEQFLKADAFWLVHHPDYFCVASFS